ncbi:MAG TPA: hypothetical protein VFU93_00280 [Acidimicrobiales bacterium]|nr:hypothetical protein [Acidimicrobiales bacterium]
MLRRTALVAALAVVAACSGGDDEIEPAPVVEDAATVELGDPVDGYRITYRVEERDGDDVTTQEATRLVERPFRSRFEAGELVRVADFGYFGEREPGDETEVRTAVPAPSPGDVRADLLDLDGGGAVRRIAGRECQVHTFGAQLLLGTVADGGDTETCIDADGLVLEEVVRDADGIVSRWVATAVDIEPETTDADFALEGVAARPAAEGGGSLREVEPTSRSEGQFYELAEVPAGFVHRGRYAVVPPQEANPEDENTRAHVIAGVVDVWVRGIDVLVLDQGGTLGRVPPFGGHPNGTPEDELSAQYRGVAESIRSAHANEVRVLLPPGRYVKVIGTLPVDELIDLLADLTSSEGEGLVYLDD